MSWTVTGSPRAPAARSAGWSAATTSPPGPLSAEGVPQHRRVPGALLPDARVSGVEGPVGDATQQGQRLLFKHREPAAPFLPDGSRRGAFRRRPARQGSLASGHG